jgi:transcriptional regulator with XRE-family HTH domain
LRRDELAMLAGISTEYYTRLEQGRDHHPSAQVLDAVARALGLDEAATAHLHSLAAPHRRTRAKVAKIRPSVQMLLDSWQTIPAYVQSRHLDVVASNAMAVALSPIYTPGENVLRSVLLDEAAQEFLPGWESRLPGLVASLRAMAGPDVAFRTREGRSFKESGFGRTRRRMTGGVAGVNAANRLHRLR